MIESIESVLDQDYSNIEIIVVDDCSSDSSKQAIEEFLSDKPAISFLALDTNIGNCKAFNIGYRKSKGKYVIDLATDDKLCKTRISEQVEAFESLDATYGVVYSDAQIMDEKGLPLYTHCSGYPSYQDDVYQHLISTYFVSPPTMMIKREVLDLLGGYDESLAYEDFDFWTRSSRYFKYHFIDKVLTEVRQVKGSKSSHYHDRMKDYTLSTIQVCHKIKEQNMTEEENRALVSRIRYEMKHSAVRGMKHESRQFYELLSQLTLPTLRDKIFLRISGCGLNLWPIVKLVKS